MAFGIPQFRGNGDQYENWSHRVRLLLEAVGVLEVSTGATASVATEKATFEELDRTAKSMLMRCLADGCLEFVRERKMTREIWSSLEATFAQKSVLNPILMRKRFSRLRLEDG